MRLVVAGLLLPVLAGCTTYVDPHAATPLEHAQAAALQLAAEQGATIDRAWFVERRGSAPDSNTGQPCTSGRELAITLLGTFPHTVTTGMVGRRGEPPPDNTVRAMIVTADAETGVPCLIGVQTGEPGQIQPPPEATELDLDAK